MLAVPLVNGSPNLLYPIHVCHFHRLFSTIIAVVYVMLTRRSTQVSILLGIVIAQRKVNLTRDSIEYSTRWGMKRFVRRWWVEHDTPEFGHSIVAGTMRRMHKVAKRKGMPICDYYTVGWVYINTTYVIERILCQGRVLYKPEKTGCGFFSFGQPLSLDFFTTYKKTELPHRYVCFHKFLSKSEKIF